MSEPRFVPWDPSKDPDPLEDARRVIAVMRRKIAEAIKLVEVPCVEGCGEWARFRDDRDRLLCPAHAREAQETHGAKLWAQDQPKVVHDLAMIRMYSTAAERRARMEESEAKYKAGTLKTFSTAEMAHECGWNLVVENPTSCRHCLAKLPRDGGTVVRTCAECGRQS